MQSRSRSASHRRPEYVVNINHEFQRGQHQTGEEQNTLRHIEDKAEKRIADAEARRATLCLRHFNLTLCLLRAA